MCPHRYWQFLLYLFIILTALELFFSPNPSLYATYSSFIGYLGLSIEATLPLPQIMANNRTRSCKGFRLSVLVSWIAGDVFKMFWFFTATTPIPWSFKLCGIFQMACDFFLGFQYWVYGDGSKAILRDSPEVELRENGVRVSGTGHYRSSSGRRSPEDRFDWVSRMLSNLCTELKVKGVMGSHTWDGPVLTHI